MNQTTTMLRELTVRYAVKADVTNQPIVVGHPLTNPRCAADLLTRLLADEASEVFAIVLLSTKHRVLAYHEVSRGTLNSTLVHPRLCAAQHKRGYVAAVVMWRCRWKASGEPVSRLVDATYLARIRQLGHALETSYLLLALARWSAPRPPSISTS